MAASVDGEAKRVVCAIGKNGVFYASALTALKREFGNPYHISNSKTFWNLGILSISPNDNKGLRYFHEQLKGAVIWLNSVVYVSSL